MHALTLMVLFVLPTTQDPAPPVPDPDPIPELASRDVKKVRSFLRGVQRANAAKLRNAREALVEIGRGALPYVPEGFLADTPPESERCLEAVLIDLTNERDHEVFVTWAHHEVAALRRLAATRLGESRHPGASAVLKDLVQDADPSVRQRAAEFLARRGDPAGFEVLVRGIAESQGPARAKLLEACAGFQSSQAPLGAPAGRLLHADEPEAVRVACLDALAAAGAKGETRLLARCLDDTHQAVKTAAVNALRRLLEDREPLESLTAFGLIEEVDRLKKLLEKRSGR